MDEDEKQYNRVFGSQFGLDVGCKSLIDAIRINTDSINELIMISDDTRHFMELSWELLCRYITDNTHLRIIDLADCGLTDQKIVFLFKALISSSSIEEFDIRGNSFGIEGLRCMVPFLKNSPGLSKLHFDNNSKFDNYCFELLVQTLYVSPIFEGLYFRKCNLTDISVLEIYTPSNLQYLGLDENAIGMEGCRTLADLLQREEPNWNT